MAGLIGGKRCLRVMLATLLFATLSILPSTLSFLHGAPPSVRPAVTSQQVQRQLDARSDAGSSAATFVAVAAIAGFAALRLRAQSPITSRARVTIEGNDLPPNMALSYAMRKAVYGIGLTSARTICKNVGINENTIVKELTPEQAQKIIEEVETGWTVGTPVLREMKNNIALLKDIGHRRALRMMKGLPVNGQATHSASRTCRKLNPTRF
mmetsp:Transcript_8086/g.18931  ORF Transcript_8086/g.18931 Transcript_8086/m.18931 type:complete len:210 (-) Transcript_8086:42-671(-)